VTSEGAVDVKEVVHLGRALKAYDKMPAKVRESFDKLITAVQNGKAVRSGDKTDLKGKLGGIAELRFDHSTDTYRTYYTTEFREVIFVLDAGDKKSHAGGEIPQEQVEALIKKRKAAEVFYKAEKSDFVKRYETRLKNRESQPGDIC
jgi:phage-related protein